MKRSLDRILTSHTGALHMPRDLQELLLAEWRKDDFDQAKIDERLRESVAGVVEKQGELGIDIVNDGEYSKSSWMGYALERMSGFEVISDPTYDPVATLEGGSKDRSDFEQFYSEAAEHIYYVEPGAAQAFQTSIDHLRTVCTGPIGYKGHDLLRRDIENLKAATEGGPAEEAFLAVVAPGSVQPVAPNEYYPDQESYFFALADALKEEYRMIVDAGFICQIDDAFLPWEYDRRLQEKNWDVKEFRKWAELAVAAVNHALEGIPEDRVRYHICWGSWNGPHSTDVPLKDIVDLVLKVNAQAYSIEAANARHEWEYKVWQDVKLPDGKLLMPGVIEHTTYVVEHPETVADRILRFANIVGRENVIAGTDCGFRDRTHPQIAWAKLKSLSEGAEIASKELWK